MIDTRCFGERIMNTSSKGTEKIILASHIESNKAMLADWTPQGVDCLMCMSFLPPKLCNLLTLKPLDLHEPIETPPDRRSWSPCN
jgi:hypothetical protein